MSTSNATNTTAATVTPEYAQMVAELAMQRAINAQLLADKESLEKRKDKAPSNRHSLGDGLTCQVAIGGKINPKTGAVSKGGGVSVYGLTKAFPVTLYKAQWFRLFAVMAQLRAFIEAHDSELSVKPTIVK
jgi:hypothetical protein